MDTVMECILDFLLEFAELIFRERKYPNPQIRTRVLTAFYSILAVLILGFGAVLVVSMVQKADFMAAAVIGGVFLLLGILFFIGILWGHKKGWKRKG